MNDFTKEELCECHSLMLPRWDIYICPKCGRQLAFLSSIDRPLSLQFIISKKLKEWRCRLFHKKSMAIWSSAAILSMLPFAPPKLYGCKRCDLWRELE